MIFKDGTSVYTMDGKKAGSLNRVVIDPATREVTHIVIQKGFLFKEDKVIAVEKVASTTDEKVDLNCSIDEVKLMSPLEVSQYVPINEDAGGQNFDPLAGGGMGDPASNRKVVMQTKRTIPDDLVAMKEGARVISTDNEQVGNVEHVYTDAGTGKVTHFIITVGVMSKARKTIPIDWVKLITDDDVFLSVGTHKLEDLTEVHV